MARRKRRKNPAWICPDVTLEELTYACEDALAATGFKEVRSRKSKAFTLLSGIYGNLGLALLVRTLPFGKCFAAGNRYKAEFKLGEFKEQPRVSLNVIPIMETDSSRETFIMTQSLDEAVADSLHSRKFRNKLLQALAERVGVMQPLEVGKNKKRTPNKR